MWKTIAKILWNHIPNPLLSLSHILILLASGYSTIPPVQWVLFPFRGGGEMTTHPPSSTEDKQRVESYLLSTSGPSRQLWCELHLIKDAFRKVCYFFKHKILCFYMFLCGPALDSRAVRTLFCTAEPQNLQTFAFVKTLW